MESDKSRTRRLTASCAVLSLKLEHFSGCFFYIRKEEYKTFVDCLLYDVCVVVVFQRCSFKVEM